MNNNDNTKRKNLYICLNCNKLYDKAEHTDGCPTCLARLELKPRYEVVEPVNVLQLNCPHFASGCTALCSDCCFEDSVVWNLEQDILEAGVLDLDRDLEHSGPSGYYDDNRGTAKSSGAELSRDDENRRLRESKLGFAEPSSDWANAGVPVVCIFDGQYLTMQGYKQLQDLGMKSAFNALTGKTFTIG